MEFMHIFEKLLEFYGPRHWWPAGTAYEMMIGAILTQNTSWSNAEKAIASLERVLNPNDIAALPEEELADLIRPSGYYNQKARRIKALTKWFQKYNYRIEDVRKADGSALRQELLEVSGIGPETADSILIYALEKPFFVVDAYTRRIISRFGLDAASGYEALRLQLDESLPAELSIYQEFHALIVEHAKQYCRKKPICTGCPLGQECQRRVKGQL